MIRLNLKLLFNIALCIVGLTLFSLVQAQNSEQSESLLSLTADQSPIDPLPYLRVWRDEDATWTLDEFLEISKTSNPDFAGLERANFGVDASAHWSVLRVLPGDNSDWIIDNQFPGMDRVSLYQLRADGSWRVVEAGRDKGRVDGDVSDLGTAFRLELNPGQESVIILRFQNIGTTLLPLTLFEEDDFMRINGTRLHYKYVFIGFMLAMIIYNLILFLATGNESIKWYLIFQIIMTAFQISGNALHLMFLPDWLIPQGGVDYNLLAVFVFAVPAIFFEKFMGAENVSRHILRPVRMIAIINLTFLPVLALTKMQFLPALTMSYLLLASAVISMTSYLVLFSIHAWQTRTIDAYIFTGAWAVSMGSLLVQASLFAGTTRPSELSLNLDEFLLVIESMILAAGLALRVHRQLRGAISVSQKLVAAQLREIRALEENDQRSQQLVNELQHELRTPVAAIVGLTEQLKSSPKRNTKEWDLLVDTIESSGRSLKVLVEDTLTIITSAHPKSTNVIEEVDLNDTLRQCLLLVEHLDKQQSVTVSLDVQTPISVIQTDRNRLIQVLLNIIQNALIHSGGDAINIKIHQDHQESFISISDNGCGMSLERLNKVFSPYYTTSSNQAGQGLNTARRIVEEQGGLIEVSSKLNVGTTFTIRLPIQSLNFASNNTNSEVSDDVSNDLEIINGSHRTTLLVVDDNEVNLLIAKGFLRKNFNLVLTRNPVEVERLIDSHSPDLLLLDLVMPHRHGFEVIEDLKKNPKYKSLPIIVVSALSDADSIERAFDLGATDYLSKPLIQLELMSRINAQLSYLELESLKDKYETLRNRLQAEENTSPSATQEDDIQQREILVNLINLSHEAYGASGKSNLAKLAEDSGLWSVTLDGSRMRARTLEKYTSLKTMPKRPNWKKVSGTANFVLTAPNIPDKYRNAISQLLETLIQHRRNQRLLASTK